jgi:hypothetical protein
MSRLKRRRFEVLYFAWAAAAAQPQAPSAQQSHEQPQLPVQTPVVQQPQSQLPQQHGEQLAGQAPPQHAAALAGGAGANSESRTNTRYNMKVSFT